MFFAIVSFFLLAAGCDDSTESESDAGAGSDLGAAETGDLIDAADLADSGSEVVSLQVGEAVEVVIEDGLGGAAVTTAGDEEYLLVLASTRLDAEDEFFGYQLFIAYDAPDTAGVISANGCSLSDEAWRDLVPEPETIPSGDPPEVGEIRELTVPTGTFAETVSARVVAVGDGAVVWEDISEDHPAELDDEFVTEFLTDFDDIILPRARGVFGIESDIDEDGRIALLFSPLTYETAVAFFSPCDLLPDACSATNDGEVLYLTPPNTIPEPYNTSSAIKEILAHELQHLIHANRAVLRNDLEEGPDNAYMLEGFGALSQDVSGYQAGNFYVTKAGLVDIDSFSFRDILVDFGRYDNARNGALRGGAYLFVRWLYDRAGSDEAMPGGTVESRGGPMLLRALMEAPESAAAVLPNVAGSTIEDIVVDFYTTLGASNRDTVGGQAPANPCFRYLPTTSDPITGRQRGANVYASFHGQAMQGPTTQPATEPDGRIIPGGVEYLILEPEEGEPQLSFTVDVDPAALARMRVLRIR